MRSSRHLALLILAGLTGVVLAQTIAPLPKMMSGRWTSVQPTGRTYTGTWSVVLEIPPEGTGPITGRMTSGGGNCGALDEPLVGTWDGNELRIESRLRPNVNATRANADCGTGRTVTILTRKPGQTGFEGETRLDWTTVPSQVTLSP